MKVFNTGANVLTTSSGGSAPCIVILDGDQDFMPGSLLLNFSNNRSEDYTLNKSFDAGFIFTTFGNNPVTITVTGYHTLTAKGGLEGRYAGGDAKLTEDPEVYYQRFNINNKSRKLLTIITGFNPDSDVQSSAVYRDVYAKLEGVVYEGYMIGFRKNPMPADKTPGYSYDITFICRTTKDTKDNNYVE